MFRIVDGFVFEGKPSPDRFDFSATDLGGGHVEVSLRRCLDWREVGPVTDAERMRLEDGPSEAELADRALANAKRAARRAKTRVRRLCKAMGLDTLLTLTYRENVTDRHVLMSDLKAFVRRVRAVIPGFAYVAAFERQKRGAWHAHIACHRFPPTLVHRLGVRVRSYSVIRSLWALTVGDRGGNIDVSRRKRASSRSPARIAAYVSKYMLKAFEDGDEWSNRFSASAFSLPEPIRGEIRASTMREALLWAWEWVGDQPLGVTFLSDFGDSFFCSTDPPPAFAGR